MRRSRVGAGFKDAIRETPELANFLCDGLQALSRADRKRISCSDSRKIAGSISLEKALATTHPNDPLWDYGVALSRHQSPDQIKWIEVHSASSTHADELLKKLLWLRGWLRESASRLDAIPREFVWIASGKVHLQPGSPQIKRIAQAGLRFVGERLILDN